MLVLVRFMQIINKNSKLYLLSLPKIKKNEETGGHNYCDSVSILCLSDGCPGISGNAR
jgi:hypothetical protein